MSRRYEEESAWHLEQLIRRKVEQGIPPAEARRAALVEFGGHERFGESVRDAVRSRPLHELSGKAYSTIEQAMVISFFLRYLHPAYGTQ